MAYYSESSCSSSLSRSDEWSFRSTSSSNSNTTSSPTFPNFLSPHFSHNNNIIGDPAKRGAIFPCLPPYHCMATLKTPNHHHITCLAVHHNLLYAASGTQITAFNLTTLSPLSPLINGRDSSSGGFIKSIAFHDDKILTAHQDTKIRVFKRRRFITSLPTLKDRILRSLSPKNYVHVRRNKKKLWIQHNDAVSGLVVKHDLIYSISWDKTLKVWRASDLKCVQSLTAHDDAINAVTVSVNGERVYTGSADGKIRVWGRDHVGRHSMVATLEKHGSTVNSLALSHDERVLLSGGCDGVILVWERESDDDDEMVLSGVLEGHEGAVLSLISLDGCDLFVSGSADRTVRIWGRGERREFCCLAVMEGHNRPVRSLAAVEQNGGVLVCSGSLDGEIKIWQVNVPELLKFSSKEIGRFV